MGFSDQVLYVLFIFVLVFSCNPLSLNTFLVLISIKKESRIIRWKKSNRFVISVNTVFDLPVFRRWQDSLLSKFGSFKNPLWNVILTFLDNTQLEALYFVAFKIKSFLHILFPANFFIFFILINMALIPVFQPLCF